MSPASATGLPLRCNGLVSCPLPPISYAIPARIRTALAIASAEGITLDFEQRTTSPV